MWRLLWPPRGARRGHAVSTYTYCTNVSSVTGLLDFSPVQSTLNFQKTAPNSGRTVPAPDRSIDRATLGPIYPSVVSQLLLPLARSIGWLIPSFSLHGCLFAYSDRANMEHTPLSLTSPSFFSLDRYSYIDQYARKYMDGFLFFLIRRPIHPSIRLFAHPISLFNRRWRGRRSRSRRIEPCFLPR